VRRKDDYLIVGCACLGIMLVTWIDGVGQCEVHIMGLGRGSAFDASQRIRRDSTKQPW
jgi:hypothetical protein